MPGKGRKNYTKGGDAARLADERAMAIPSSVWASIAKRYVPEVRAIVEAAIARGGLSLQDIESLEFAEHEQLQVEIATMRAEGVPSWSDYMDICNAALQMRKHLRTLRVAMSPVSTPHTQRHPQPKSVGARRRGRDEADTGDDLVN